MNRSLEWHVSGKVIDLPAFFPSISSVKTNLLPVEYATLLVSLRVPRFLFSAYDVENCAEEDRGELLGALRHASKTQVVLFDSGNYEGYWHRDKTWTEERFADFLSADLARLTFCFDNQSPSLSRGPQGIAEDVIARVRKESTFSDLTSVEPIVHGPREDLPEICRIVAEQLHPLVVAVPERELGDGTLTRMETVVNIRKALNRTGVYYPLHLLGTGNPRSLFLYALSGADTFDGLEWCQTCIDPETGLLFHFQQRDVLTVSEVSGDGSEYVPETLINNLKVLTTWESLIRDAVRREIDSCQLAELFHPTKVHAILSILESNR